MNQAAFDVGPGPVQSTSVQGIEDLSCEARKDGRVVLALQCARSGDSYLVACEAFPIDDVLGTPPERRSYRFDDRQDAEVFVHETVRALEYLGCSV